MFYYVFFKLSAGIVFITAHITYMFSLNDMACGLSTYVEINHQPEG